MKIINPHNYSLPADLVGVFQDIFISFSKRFQIKNREVEIAIVDEKEIRELNFLYRNKDKATDVLSFPLSPEFSHDLLGAIYFCFSEIEKKGENLLEEFRFLFVHSLLHLIGYEHGEEMFFLQEEILKEG